MLSLIPKPDHFNDSAANPSEPGALLFLKLVQANVSSCRLEGARFAMHINFGAGGGSIMSILAQTSSCK